MTNNKNIINLSNYPEITNGFCGHSKYNYLELENNGKDDF